MRDCAFFQILALSLVFHLVLIIYGEWQDCFLNIKFTDVDYHVFTDAASIVSAGGSPFLRATYRYTPLLAWLLLPNIHLHVIFGKLLFTIGDLLVGYLLYRILVGWHAMPERTAAVSVAVAWLMNPLVATISTRGNADSLVCLACVGTIYFLLAGRPRIAAIVLGMAVHLKLFPIIFVVPIFAFLVRSREPDVAERRLHLPRPPAVSGMKPSPLRSSTIVPPARPMGSLATPALLAKGPLLGRLFSRKSVEFALISGLVFGALTGLMYWRYGQQYISEAFVHHLTRKDHRHNFSPYFLLFHLESVQALPWIFAFLTFLPQLALLAVVGVKYGAKGDLPFACALQTFLFVTFNKVCTSQYFLWYTVWLPLVVPSVRMSRTGWLLVLGLWGAAQAIWLNLARLLEFEGQDTFQLLWGASLLFMAVNTAIAVAFVRCYQQTVPARAF